jgi:lysophospholipase L1-like esterase
LAGKRIQKAIFSVLPLILLVVGAEALLRVTGWPPSGGKQVFEHSEPFWITDPDLRTHPFPHREMDASFSVSTDAQGLRAPLHTLEKPRDTYRILFLGCSTTFGWGVDDEQSYPARLQAALDTKGYAGIEVLNGGQPGYTSFQGLWFLKHTGLRYDPDLVVFGYVVQDARRAAYTDRSQAVLQRDARFLKDHLLYRLHLYLGARQLIDDYRIRAKERDAEGTSGTWRVPPEDYVANLREMDRLVRSHSARLALFGFPLEREGYTGDHRRLLRIAATELGLPHFDPQKTMEDESRKRALYFPRDKGHANAEGLALIADWLLEWLERDHLLGSTPRSP